MRLQPALHHLPSRILSSRYSLSLMHSKQTYNLELWGYSEQHPVWMHVLPLQVQLPLQNLKGKAAEDVQEQFDDAAKAIAYDITMYLNNLGEPDGFVYAAKAQAVCDRTTFNKLQAYTYGGVPQLAVRLVAPDGRICGKYASDLEMFTSSFRDTPFFDSEEGKVRSLISL